LLLIETERVVACPGERAVLGPSIDGGYYLLGMKSGQCVAPRRVTMSYGFLDIAMTPSVRGVQAKMSADHIWQNFKGHREFNRFSADEAAVIGKSRQLLRCDRFGDWMALRPTSGRSAVSSRSSMIARLPLRIIAAIANTSVLATSWPIIPRVYF
jgi:hypothetical protein